MATSARAARLLGQFWLYTFLRIALFGGVWGVLWLVNVRGMLGVLIAVVLSVPLSFVLLARPRAALAGALELRASERKDREDDLRHRLAGESLDGQDVAERNAADRTVAERDVADSTVAGDGVADSAESAGRAKPKSSPTSEGKGRP